MTKDSKTGEGKLDWMLLPFDALKEVVKVQEFGSTKYPIDSWKAMSGDYKRRYLNAAMRHMEAIISGEDLAGDSQLPHAAHLACNALFLTYFLLKEKGTDWTKYIEEEEL